MVATQSCMYPSSVTYMTLTEVCVMPSQIQASCRRKTVPAVYQSGLLNSPTKLASNTCSRRRTCRFTDAPTSSAYIDMVHILLRLLENQTDQWHRCVSFLSLEDNLNLARTNRALRARYTDASSCAQVLRDLRFGPPTETCFVHELPACWISVPTPYQQLVLLVNHFKQCYVCEHFEKNHHYVASKTVQMLR